MVPDPYSSLFDDANGIHSSGASEGNETVLHQTMEMLERRNQELSLLHELATRLNKTIETKAAMEVGLDLILKLTGAESIAMVLIHPEEGHFDLIAQSGIEVELQAAYAVSPFNRAVYEPGKIDPETTANLIEYMILTRRILTTADFHAMPRFDLKPIFDVGYKSILAFPIHFDEQVFGIAMLGSKQPDHFDQHAVQLGENIAAQLGSTLRNHALVASLGRRIDHFQSIVDTGSYLQYAPQAYVILPRVLRRVCRALRVKNAAVFLLKGDRFEVVGTAETLTPIDARTLSPHHRRMLESDVALCVNDRNDPDTDPIQRASLERVGRRAAMGIRLYARDHAFGLLFVNQEEPRVWQSDEAQLLKAFAHQIAHALENRRLLEGSEQQVRELKSLAQVGRLIASANPPDSALYSVADEIARVFGVDYVGFHLREGDMMRLVAESHSTGAPARLPILPHQYRILDELDPVRVTDSEVDAVNPRQREFLNQYNMRADLGVALVSGQKALGILYLSHYAPRQWSNAEVELAETFAQQIAGALMHAGLLRESQTRVRDLRALSLNANLIAHSRSPETALPQAASDLRRLLGVDYVGFHLVEGDEFRIVTEAQHNLTNHRYPIKPYHRIVIDYAQKLIVTNRDRDARDPNHLANLKQYGYAADVAVPMVARGKVIGILFVSQKAPRDWRDAEIDLIVTYAQQIATVLENVQLLNDRERRVIELEQLTELNEVAATILDEDVLVEIAMGVLKQLLNADRVILTTFENGKPQASRSSDGKVYDRQPVPPSPELDEWLRSKRPLIVDPAHPPLDMADFKARAEFHHSKSNMMVPLMSVNETLGVLNFVYQTEHLFTPAEIRLAEAAAYQLAIAFSNARLLRDQKKQIAKLSRLSEFGQWCGSLRDSTNLITRAVERIPVLLDAPAASIRLLNGEILSAGASWGYRNPEARDHTILVNANLNRILYQHKPYPICDLEAETSLPPHWRERQRQEGFRALLMVPMIAENQVIGILTVFHHTVKHWDESEVKYAQTVANTLALAFANDRQIEHARDNSEELRATLDSVFSGVFTTDADGRILTWNNAAQRITGYTFKQMRGKLWHLHGPRVGADRREDMIVFEAMASENPCFSLAPRLFVCADGQSVELREAAAVLRDRNGRVRGAVCAFWDRTQEHATERAQFDFINLVTHQLDNKLAAIIWSAEQLLREDMTPAARVKWFKIISRTLNDLRAFNTRFIEFQREHSSRQQADSEVELRPFLRTKLRVWRETHPTHKFRVDGALDRVLADEMRLGIVIDNLLENAVKYSAPRSTISLGGKRRSPEQFELTIHNPGKPIDPELLPRLFERFERGNSDIPGAGLGLWLVRTKLHEMGGDISVASPHRGGTTFTITLRCKPSAGVAADKDERAAD